MDNFTGYYIAHQKEDDRIQRRNDTIMQLRMEIAVSKDKGEPTTAKEEILNSLLEDIEREKIRAEIWQYTGKLDMRYAMQRFTEECRVPREISKIFQSHAGHDSSEEKKLEILWNRAAVYRQEHPIDFKTSSIEELRQYLDFLQKTKESIEIEEESEQTGGIAVIIVAVLVVCMFIGIIMAFTH